MLSTALDSFWFEFTLRGNLATVQNSKGLHCGLVATDITAHLLLPSLPSSKLGLPRATSFLQTLSLGELARDHGSRQENGLLELSTNLLSPGSKAAPGGCTASVCGGLVGT